MNRSEAVAWLDAHTNLEATAGRIEGLSLAPVEQLLEAMGDPHLAYPVVHVTGTNGKGSVANMVSALLEAHGLEVGLYTSPHLNRVNERLARNRSPASDDELAAALSDVAAAATLVDETPSYFEILTAAALGWFATTAVEVAVVEVGLLGEFDATNVVRSDVAVVTNVGKDHTDGAGDWSRDIAREKAGIIKPSSVAVVGDVAPPLVEIFEGRPSQGLWLWDEQYGLEADQVAVGGRLVSVRSVHDRYPEVFLSVHGAHQGRNAATAVAATEAFFDRALGHEIVAEALGSIELPGRFEIVGRHPLIVVDAAHNPPGAAALRTTLDDVLVGGRRIWVLGVLEGRDLGEMLIALGVAPSDLVLACRPASPRAVADAELADAARALGLDAEAVGTVPAALDRAMAVATEDDAVVVAGSSYVVGPARHLLSESA